jgi:hypothetical protein
VISTVDPEARHAHKTRHRRQDGYKAHVKVEPDSGLPTLGRPSPRTVRTPERRPVGQRGEHAALDRFPDTAE